MRLCHGGVDAFFKLVQQFIEEFEDNPFFDFKGKFQTESAASGLNLFAHNLGSRPADVIITGNTAGTSVVVGNLTQNTVQITVGADTNLRFLIGRFE